MALSFVTSAMTGRSSIKRGLCYYLEENKRVKADDGYQAGDSEVTKTPSGIFHPTKRSNSQEKFLQQSTSNTGNCQQDV